METCFDHFGCAYGIVNRGGFTSKMALSTASNNLLHAQQLVRNLAIDAHAWPNILSRLGVDIRAYIQTHRHGNQDIRNVVAQLVSKGDIHIVRLPEVCVRHAIRCNNDEGICFIRRDFAHTVTKFTPLDITNETVAQQCVDGLGLARSALVQGLLRNELDEYANAEDPHTKLIMALTRGELLAYFIDVPPMAPPKKVEEYVSTAVAGAKPISLAPEQADKMVPVVVLSSLSERRGQPPTSLNDASARLESMKDEIAANGHLPKYSDPELTAQAESGEVANERFHVRFMETAYLKSRTNPSEALGGALGVTMEGKTGKGAKYWSTTFDQIEDADTDPKIISEKLGLEYNSHVKYTLVIIDTQKAIPLTGVKSVSATFANVSDFANTELPDDFPQAFTDKVMTPEFQAAYAEQYNAAVEVGALPNAWSKDTKMFEKYLQTTELTADEQDIMLKRMDMQGAIGNNQLYVGNGLTEDVSSNTNRYGAVETLNFERKEINLQTLKDNNAIAILSL